MNLKEEYFVAIVGGDNVGKTSLAIRIVEDKSIENYHPSISSNIYEIEIRKKEKTIEIEIDDTPNDDGWSGLKYAYVRRSNLCLIVYSIDDKHSFVEAKNELKYIFDKSNQIAKNFQKFKLIGNKIDLEKKHEISNREIIKMMKRYNVSMQEISVVASNYKLVFNLIKNEVYETFFPNKQTETKKKQGNCFLI